MYIFLLIAWLVETFHGKRDRLNQQACCLLELIPLDCILYQFRWQYSVYFPVGYLAGCKVHGKSEAESASMLSSGVNSLGLHSGWQYSVYFLVGCLAGCEVHGKRDRLNQQVCCLSVLGATFGLMKANLGLRSFVVSTGFGAVMG